MVWAVPLHAQTRRISLNLKNATIQQAVIALQQQGYSLSVKADDVDMKAPVDIHARNEELQAVVDRIFAGQDVNCIINDKKYSDYESPVSAFVRRLAAGIIRNRTGERSGTDCRSSASPC